MSEHWLLTRMRSFGDQPALAFGPGSVSYARLLELVGQWLQRFARDGVHPGDVVAIVGEYSVQSASLLLALMQHGATAVPLTPKVLSEQLLTLAQATAVYTLEGEEASFSARSRPAEPSPLIEQLRARREPGVIGFTSGSSGTPKGIVHSLHRILARYEKPVKPLTSLVFLLFNHLGGFNTLVAIMASGGTAVFVEGRTPDAICEAIERWRVQLLPTSPSFLNMLLMSEAYKRHDVSSLKLITYGTEPMPEPTLRRVAETFPGVRLKQTYGLSEAASLPTLSRDNHSTWFKVGGEGFEVKVEGRTLKLRSPNLMLGYLNAPSPFDAEGWLDTGDEVETDGEWLRVLGRRSELINVGGEKVFPTEIENVILELANVQDVTVRGRKNAVLGSIVTASVVLRSPEDPTAFIARLKSFCESRLPKHQVPMLVDVVEARPLEGIKKSRVVPRENP